MSVINKMDGMRKVREKLIGFPGYSLTITVGTKLVIGFMYAAIVVGKS